MRLHRKDQIHEHITSEEWFCDLYATERFEEELSYMDEIVLYEHFGKNKDIIEGRDQTRQEGFSEWGQRRINEMRAVKEARLRAKLSNTAPEYNNGPSSTLPFRPDDIEGHGLLTYILSDANVNVAHCRRVKQPPFPRIYNFAWFGEYKWQWHRNESGCWILGYADACDSDSFPCPCCCSWGGSMYFPCSCKDFGDQPAPEEMQRCALVEWVQGRLWDTMMEDESVRVRELGIVEVEEEMEWELFSDAASEGWSVVSSEEEFELLES